MIFIFFFVLPKKGDMGFALYYVSGNYKYIRSIHESSDEAKEEARKLKELFSLIKREIKCGILPLPRETNKQNIYSVQSEGRVLSVSNTYPESIPSRAEVETYHFLETV